MKNPDDAGLEPMKSSLKATRRVSDQLVRTLAQQPLLENPRPYSAAVAAIGLFGCVVQLA